MTMPSSEARIETDNAGRYLTQLCRHAAAMAHQGGRLIRRHTPTTDNLDLRVESSDTDATITLGSWGRCTVRADAAVLTARIDAADENTLEQIQEIIGSNLNRFGQREGTTVIWQRLATRDAPDPPGLPDAGPGSLGTQRGRMSMVLVTLTVVLVAALHLGLGGAALMNSTWTGGTVGLLLLVVAIKAAIVLGGFAFRRMRSHPPG